MTDLVLVVDDTPQNLLVTSRHLEAAGYRVATASSGEQALDYLATHHADLVILDVLMPGIGGLETCRRIRAAPNVAATPVMFMTALGDRDATAPALEAGADDLLAKPFARAELLLRARALIRQHQRVRAREAAAEQDRDRIREVLARLRCLSNELDVEVAQRVVGELVQIEDVLGGC